MKQEWEAIKKRPSQGKKKELKHKNLKRQPTWEIQYPRQTNKQELQKERPKEMVEWKSTKELKKIS